MNLTDIVIPPWLKIAVPIVLVIAIVAGFHFYVVGQREDARSRQYAVDKATIDKLTADVRSTTQAARLADLERARAVETAQAGITRKTNDDMQSQLSSARQRLATYVLQHPASGAGQGGGGTADMPGASDRPNVAYGADQYTVVSVGDMERCTEAVTRLKNAQAWWAKVSATPNP